MEIQITMPEEVFYQDERHLQAFAVPSVRLPHVFRFEMVDVMPEPEGTLLVKTPTFSVYEQNGLNVRYFGSDRARVRVVNDGMDHAVLVERSRYRQYVSTKTVLECISMEHLLARVNGVILHCSYIDCGGRAILFTAPSETGKSTQAELWKQYRGAEIINGDRAAVRLEGDALVAEGIPFAGSSQYCSNRSLPLAAVVYLAQAKETSIRSLRGYEAFSRIWEGVSVNTWDREDVQRASSLVERVVRQVPVYLLSCTPDESAVVALEQMLKE
ncbi:MAG: hypothetical protein J6A88_01890 [Oscillospiraceae bacterium]|nr:hypothetical protein [Oscillospiraceae bacterium]